MTKVQRYKVGYYSDEWGMSSNTPCLVPADNGYAVKFEDYFKLEAENERLKAELTKYRDAPVVAYRHLMEDGWEYFDAPTGDDCPKCVPLIVKPGEEK